MRRAQYALEFVIMVSFGLIIGLIFMSVLAASLYDSSEEQRRSSLNDIGYHIQDELILASMVEDGYKRNISLPQKADRFTYTITSTPYGVTLGSGNQKLFFPTPEFSGGFSKGNIRITKEEGVITVS